MDGNGLMKERIVLGDTDLRVSPIGLGLAALGRPGYINVGHAEDMNGMYEVEAMEARAHEVLDTAFDAGVRYFDVARSYGRAEAFLGSWLSSRGYPPEEVVVGSKWGYTYTAGWKVDAEVHEVKEHSLEVLNRQWEESQSHLGSHLDLYQIHSATLKSGVLENDGVLERLNEIKKRGTAIGLSVSGPHQAEVIERALNLQIDGVRLFDSVQATWNLLEGSAGPMLNYAHQADIGVIIKEALANGRLTDRNEDDDFVDQYRSLKAIARRLGTTVDGVAIAAVLSQPWVDIVLSGAARSEHLISNLNAIDVVWDQDAAARVEDLKESPEEYWARRSEMDWN
jgi:aryl-alcohol dehydrogenase-like predicted oxidoreductase